MRSILGEAIVFTRLFNICITMSRNRPLIIASFFSQKWNELVSLGLSLVERALDALEVVQCLYFRPRQPIA